MKSTSRRVWHVFSLFVAIGCGVTPRDPAIDERSYAAEVQRKPLEGTVTIGARKPAVKPPGETKPFAGQVTDSKGNKFPIRYADKDPAQVDAAVMQLDDGQCMDQDAEILEADGRTITPVTLTICMVDKNARPKPIIKVTLKYPPPPGGTPDESDDPDYWNSDEYDEFECVMDDTSTDTSTNTAV